MNWLQRLRLKMLAIVGALLLVAFGLVTVVSLPVWAAVGTAVAALALAVNTMASRLDSPTCLDCGTDLTGEPAGLYGVICPGCGAVNQVDGDELRLADGDASDEETPVRS